MNTDAIISKFESRDSHQIWEATWAILGSSDRAALSKLEPEIVKFTEILDGVKMGGGFRSNETDTRHALKYIEDMANGKCRCSLYASNNIELLNPNNEESQGHIEILESETDIENYEKRYKVRCTDCEMNFKVREVHGWHVPWYEWKVES